METSSRSAGERSRGHLEGMPPHPWRARDDVVQCCAGLHSLFPEKLRAVRKIPRQSICLCSRSVCRGECECSESQAARANPPSQARLFDAGMMKASSQPHPRGCGGSGVPPQSPRGGKKGGGIDHPDCSDGTQTRDNEIPRRGARPERSERLPRMKKKKGGWGERGLPKSPPGGGTIGG
jgi:hypothetical protein